MTDVHPLLTPTVIDDARRRDPDAIVAIYRTFSSPVYAYLMRQTRNPAWAEDLTGEVFLEVLGAIDRFDGSADGLKAWVFRIARNTLIDHFRKESRRRHESIDAAPELVDVAELRIDPEAEALSNVERDRIIGFVDDLPPDQREVVMLRIVADLPIAEVADIVGKTQGAVKALQHRAVRGLARRMGLAGGEP
jgi:RNA polymerase sigma-70 factor (ECF subfamily)